MTVSVVVPTYYRNDRLRGAIESALAQTVPVEVVVVDDSGEAHAEPVATEYDVTYVPLSENRGGNPARMAGIERSSGDYVQLLDDDDRLHPTKLERQLPDLDATTGVSYTGMDFEGTDPRLPDPAVRGEVLERALAFDCSPCVTSTMLLTREALDAVLPLADRPGADDLGLIVDLARTTRFAAVDEVLVTRGLDDDSRGKSLGLVQGRRDILREYADLYARYPAAERQARADTHRQEGETRLRAGERASALRAFARAARTRPTPAAAARLLGACGGRRTYRLSTMAVDRFL